MIAENLSVCVMKSPRSIGFIIINFVCGSSGK